MTKQQEEAIRSAKETCLNFIHNFDSGKVYSVDTYQDCIDTLTLLNEAFPDILVTQF